eukprot:249280_1
MPLVQLAHVLVVQSPHLVVLLVHLALAMPLVQSLVQLVHVLVVQSVGSRFGGAVASLGGAFGSSGFGDVFGTVGSRFGGAVGSLGAFGSSGFGDAFGSRFGGAFFAF